MYSYLQKLPLTNEERAKLNDLAAESPAALLSMMRANPKAFEGHLEPDRIEAIMDLLNHRISDQERQVLETSNTGFHKLGAVVGRHSPELRPPDYDIEERNRLFDELRYLESQDPSSDKVKQRINVLTKQLDEIMSKPV